MNHLNLLIKPASGNCNLRCKYCFYHDITEKRKIPSYGIMSLDTIETIVKKVCDYLPSGECTIAFQGGEPTLTGLDFFKAFVEYQKKYKSDKLIFHNAIQTNGMVIDEEWAKFLSENNFLVGISLDGHEDIHDLYRIDANENGTFARVMESIHLLEKYKVEFNVLTVVTAQVAKNIDKIYKFFKENNLKYQQYIACLDPLDQKHGQYKYSLSPSLYGRFLCHLFDQWYNDIQKGEFVYNRYFENLVGMLIGHLPESCGLIGHCARQVVVEADGSVYPCDYYVLDQYRIGNLITDGFDDIEENRDKSGFIQHSMVINEKCKYCKWAKLCRGGCRRDREPVINGVPSLNHFCESYQQFFEYAYPRLVQLARKFGK